jgi:hypothetical protein
MDARYEPRKQHAPRRRWLRHWLLVAAFLLALPVIAEVQGLDICGCANFPGLTDFQSGVPSTWPPGTTLSGTTITFVLPPDGILRFRNFLSVNRFYAFQRNALNTPVTILVAGNFLVQNTGCCYDWDLAGQRGSAGTSTAAGVGGLAGHGGFRGGDGANQAINGAAIGGTGFGPAGGLAGNPAASCDGGHGQFLGVPELMPLLGLFVLSQLAQLFRWRRRWWRRRHPDRCQRYD